jgi:hypothetical protein
MTWYDNPAADGNPFACPNLPPCGHPGFVHDIYDLDDRHPRCCAEGCTCGAEYSAARKRQASA